MTDHDPIDKKNLSERDICTKFITPAIKDVAGWNITQFYEEFTLGKIHVRGKRVARGVRDRADFILFHSKNHPLAIIEAKDNHHDMGAGMQQALRYAEMLDIPFAYSTNGDGFIDHDRTQAGGKLERMLGMNDFPSLDQLWKRYKAWKQIRPEQERIVKRVEQLLSLCDALEGRLQSADALAKRGRLFRAVMAMVGGQDGE